MREFSKTVLFCLVLLLTINQITFAQSAATDAGSKNGGVNINTAGQGDLEKLPGIGPSLAKKILEFRQKNGGFKNPSDLMAVPGIGEKKYEQLKNLITVK